MKISWLMIVVTLYLSACHLLALDIPKPFPKVGSEPYKQLKEKIESLSHADLGDLLKAATGKEYMNILFAYTNTELETQEKFDFLLGFSESLSQRKLAQTNYALSRVYRSEHAKALISYIKKSEKPQNYYSILSSSPNSEAFRFFAKIKISWNKAAENKYLLRTITNDNLVDLEEYYDVFPEVSLSLARQINPRITNLDELLVAIDRKKNQEKKTFSEEEFTKLLQAYKSIDQETDAEHPLNLNTFSPALHQALYKRNLLQEPSNRDIYVASQLGMEEQLYESFAFTIPLLTDAAPYKRVKGIEKIIEKNDLNSCKILYTLLQDQNEEVRLAALQGIMLLVDEDDKSKEDFDLDETQFYPLFKDQSVDVVVEALELLSTYSKSSTTKLHVKKLLYHENEHVQIAAIHCYERGNWKEEVQDLNALLYHENWAIRARTAKAVGTLVVPKYSYLGSSNGPNFHMLEDAFLNEKDEEVKKVLMRFLGRTSNKNIIDEQRRRSFLEGKIILKEYIKLLEFDNLKENDLKAGIELFESEEYSAMLKWLEKANDIYFDVPKQKKIFLANAPIENIEEAVINNSLEFEDIISLPSDKIAQTTVNIWFNYMVKQLPQDKTLVEKGLMAHLSHSNKEKQIEVAFRFALSFSFIQPEENQIDDNSESNKLNPKQYADFSNKYLIELSKHKPSINVNVLKAIIAQKVDQQALSQYKKWLSGKPEDELSQSIQKLLLFSLPSEKIPDLRTEINTIILNVKDPKDYLFLMDSELVMRIYTKQTEEQQIYSFGEYVYYMPLDQAEIYAQKYQEHMSSIPFYKSEALLKNNFLNGNINQVKKALGLSDLLLKYGRSNHVNNLNLRNERSKVLIQFLRDEKLDLSPALLSLIGNKLTDDDLPSVIEMLVEFEGNLDYEDLNLNALSNFLAKEFLDNKFTEKNLKLIRYCDLYYFRIDRKQLSMILDNAKGYSMPAKISAVRLAEHFFLQNSSENFTPYIPIYKTYFKLLGDVVSNPNFNVQMVKELNTFIVAYPKEVKPDNKFIDDYVKSWTKFLEDDTDYEVTNVALNRMNPFLNFSEWHSLILKHEIDEESALYTVNFFEISKDEVETYIQFLANNLSEWSDIDQAFGPIDKEYMYEAVENVAQNRDLKLLALLAKNNDDDIQQKILQIVSSFFKEEKLTSAELNLLIKASKNLLNEQNYFGGLRDPQEIEEEEPKFEKPPFEISPLALMSYNYLGKNFSLRKNIKEMLNAQIQHLKPGNSQINQIRVLQLAYEKNHINDDTVKLHEDTLVNSKEPYRSFLLSLGPNTHYQTLAGLELYSENIDPFFNRFIDLIVLDEAENYEKTKKPIVPDSYFSFQERKKELMKEWGFLDEKQKAIQATFITRAVTKEIVITWLKEQRRITIHNEDLIKLIKSKKRLPKADAIIYDEFIADAVSGLPSKEWKNVTAHLNKVQFNLWLDKMIKKFREEEDIFLLFEVFASVGAPHKRIVLNTKLMELNSEHFDIFKGMFHGGTHSENYSSDLVLSSPFWSLPSTSHLAPLTYGNYPIPDDKNEQINCINKFNKLLWFPVNWQQNLDLFLENAEPADMDQVLSFVMTCKPYHTPAMEVLLKYLKETPKLSHENHTLFMSYSNYYRIRKLKFRLPVPKKNQELNNQIAEELFRLYQTSENKILYINDLAANQEYFERELIKLTKQKYFSAKHIFLIEWVDKSKRKALFEQIVAHGHPNDFENFSFYLDLYAKRDPWVMKEKEKAYEDALFEDSSFDDF